jgi:hypothetical protein
MTATDLSPLGMQTIPEGMNPCAACGVTTTGPMAKYPVHSRIVLIAGGERAEEMAAGAAIDLPTCADCQAIDDTAHAIVAANPGIVRALGTVATWRITTALYGLDVLGHRLPEPDIAPGRLGALIHRLSVPGAMARYSSRFSPVWLPDASTKYAARERWSAVGDAARDELRRGAVDWMQDGRPPRDLPHPQGHRCEWCGTATAPGRRTSEAWFDDLCVACATVKADGGRTYEALWEAIDPDHAIRRRRAELPDLDGVRSFSQSGGGDGTPWSHLHPGGAPALREHVARLVEAS